MTIFFLEIPDFFYMLVNILTNIHQMNVIQTDSFEILYLGYNVIMVSKGRWFDNCFVLFFNFHLF